MECKLCLQDPTSADTTYLFEALIEAAQKAVQWKGIFAFASKGAIDALVVDPVVQHYLGRAPLDLLVGIDAITNRPTLERLKELSAQHQNFRVNVFWNETSALFHPKASFFTYRDGKKRLIVGSGNLTPGGLREHFEAFTVLTAAPEEELDTTAWEQFFVRHAVSIREIDEAALKRAEQNKITRKPGERRPGEKVEPTPGALEKEAELSEPVASDSARVLIAQIPKAGGRWHQVHFNKEVIKSFFRVKPNSPQRVYFVAKSPGVDISTSEVHPCVYSNVNKNYKIELGARHGAPYPDVGVPIAIFVELQTRSFQYTLLFPGDNGYDEMLRMTQDLPSLGKGHRRVLTSAGELRKVWPTATVL